MILDGAMQGHYQIIKQLRGVPGVQPERFQEGFNIRHCALSLVGEPIFYPHINEFLDMLHQRRISSFLVTNAQFPDQLAALRPVTQLYLSIDATNKQALKTIDRPLFGDYWERFLRCLDELALKGQRTVYRLTLVKEYNTEDVDGYVTLIRRGRPDFIEIKGVTYCGFGDNSPLTMQNVPFQHEVISFAKQLMDRLSALSSCDNGALEYGLACEHEHSCSILIADKNKFLKDGQWHTWIDYDRFHDLIKSGQPFTSLDYTAPTPAWAVYGAPEKGFDPAETRFGFRESSMLKSTPQSRKRFTMSTWLFSTAFRNAA
jgi:tRNA wybutosine-synthesizing protein 1